MGGLQKSQELIGFGFGIVLQSVRKAADAELGGGLDIEQGRPVLLGYPAGEGDHLLGPVFHIHRFVIWIGEGEQVVFQLDHGILGIGILHHAAAHKPLDAAIELNEQVVPVQKGVEGGVGALGIPGEGLHGALIGGQRGTQGVADGPELRADHGRRVLLLLQGLLFRLGKIEGLVCPGGAAGPLDLGKAPDCRDGPKAQIDDGGQKSAQKQYGGTGIAA